MRKYILFAIFLLIVSLLGAEVVNYQIAVPEPDIEKTRGFSKVIFDGSTQMGETGMPTLPYYGVKVLLPMGHDAISAKITKSEKTIISEEMVLEATQLQTPLSLGSTTYLDADMELYRTIGTFPKVDYENLTTEYFTGHSIAFLAVSPIEYDSNTNSVYYYQNIEVSVNTSSSESALEATKLLSNKDRIKAQLNNIVQNSDYLSSYYYTATRDGELDYLIIAEEAKVSNWQELVNIHTKRGLICDIVTVESIENSSTGVDLQDQIRNYIKQRYIETPFSFLLLAGDVDVIPSRGLWGSVNNGGTEDFNIPADMYYSCLDRATGVGDGPDWNLDNDESWGEFNETDMIPELAVGRACYNSDQEITNFIYKTDMYLNYPLADELTSTIMVGEDLGWDAWGGEYMNEMIGGSSINGHTTVGIPEDWTIDTLYDMNSTWSSYQLYEKMNVGPNLLNHLGHANTTYVMKLVNSDVNTSNITNNGINHNFTVSFSQGCYAGAFDNRDTNGNFGADCIAEKFMSIPTGSVAVLMNSRYGWGDGSGTDGASQFYHREYIDALFEEEIYDLGFVLNDAKIDAIPFLSGVMYWSGYELNLQGDPALSVWTDIPLELTLAYQEAVIIGASSLLINGDQPGIMVTVSNGDISLGHGITDDMGQVTIEFNEAINEITDLTVSAIKHNYLPYTGSVTVLPASGPYVISSNPIFEEYGNYLDGSIQSLDSLNVSIDINNIGLDATDGDLTITLTSESAQVTIIEGECTANQLAASSIETLLNNFTLYLSAGIVDGTNIPFNVEISDASASWNSGFILNVKAPVLNFSSYSLVILEGEDNVLDPGESAEILLTYDNIGAGYSYELMSSLFSYSSFVSISGSSAIPQINPGTEETTPTGFVIDVADDCPTGEYLDISVLGIDIVAAATSGEFQLPVGISAYDFENGMIGWESMALTDGFTNEWHLSNANNSTDGGLFSMKFGGTGSGQYANSAHGALVSPIIPVAANTFVTFKHWMSAEEFDNSEAWDGGMLDISINGGPFESITPVDGYSHVVHSNDASPFAPGIPCFSGNINWEEVELDLTQFSGNVQIRFVFGSDGAVQDDGWFIDDFTIGTYTASEDSNIIPEITTLLGNYPNPFNPTTNIRFSLANQSKVELSIYNVKGQKVKTLINEVVNSGNHNVSWEGKDNAGNTAASGIYFYRLKTNKHNSVKKMILMK